MRLLVDMSSIIWTCLSVGKDAEGAEYQDEDGKKHWVNTAAYGYEAAVNSIKATLERFNLTPIDMVMVIEGMNAKAQRLMINREYKSKRGKRPIEAYEQFNALKHNLIDVFKSLGAISFQQDNVEGDDAIAWLALNSQDDVVIRSNDNDLSVLSGTNDHGAKIITYIGGEVDTNKYGMFPLEYVTLYKALVGDSGDTIKGIKGFGHETWIKFHSEFGEDGMEELCRLARLGSLQELEEEAEQNKLIKQIWDGRAEFLNSWKLASLHPEWVDTMHNVPVWGPGMVTSTCKDERLVQWAGKTLLVTAGNWNNFRSRFSNAFKARPWIALDIETSTPEESDDWLQAQGNPDGVDVLGSELTGMSLTFGTNMQNTVYISVDHTDTNNVTKDQVRELLEEIQASGVEIVIQNVSFEGTVLFNEFGKHWYGNGYNGLLANWLDTKLEASYVDENDSLGLKKLSRKWLNYDQVEYKTVTTIDNVQYKMNELSAEHVFSYATDDTICTAALHNFFKLFMELEGTYEVYKEVEIASSYLHTQSYIHGTKISLQTLQELRQIDEEEYALAWNIVRDYLIQKGWEGTATPVYKTELKAADIKEAHLIVTGQKLDTQVRTPAKLLAMIQDPLLKDGVEKAIAGEFELLNELVAMRFKGEPEFNMGSPTQKVKLLYEVMGLPIRVYNKPTDAAKARGERQGSPKTDNLAIMYALQDAKESELAVLNAMRIMQMVSTRKSLYYDTYGGFVHWKTGRVHSSHNQCATNTRRASSSAPNVQQVSKNQKVEGYSPRVREVYVPHKKGAVIVSMDFMAQELRVIADYSKDPNMVACFVGDNLRDMHAMTGLGIWNARKSLNWSYETFVAALEDKSNEFYVEVKKMRGLGKQTNFTTEFGAAAPKLAQTIMVTEEEAQVYIEAKEAAFPVVGEWKETVIAEAKRCGFVRTKLGGKRHLREALTSTDRFISSKAERQAVNFKVQGSSAEMTKLAEGRMFKANLEQLFDCEIIAAIHDEVIASVMIEDLFDFIPAMHNCMIQPYADMVIPVKSSISFGKSFGPAHQIEIGDVPTREAIEKGLAELENY